MKKLLYFAVAITSVLLAASCQKEQVAPESAKGDMVTATVTVQAPGQLVTKAVGDGQTADNLVFAVYDEAGNELTDLRQGDWKYGIGVQNELVFDNSPKPQVTFTTTLVRGKEYTFVCWAQYKDEAATEYYNFEDMKNIKVSYDNFDAQDEKRDAFFAAVATGVVTDNFSKDIVLHRPFAQVNVGSSDMLAAELAGLDLTKLQAEMTIAHAATTLHTFVGVKAEDNDGDGKVSGDQTVTFNLAPSVSQSNFDGTGASATHEWLTVNSEGHAGKTYGWLAMNYFLVNDGDVNGQNSVDGTAQVNTTVSFNVHEVIDGTDTPLCSYDVHNVPVQRNYRSHILGNVLTAEGTLTVIIEPAFLEPDYVVSVWDGVAVSEPAKDAAGNYLVTKPEELAWFQTNKPDANIYLVNDIDLAGQPWTPITYFNGEKVLTFEGLPVTKAGETYPTIHGLNIRQTAGKAAGLFGGVTFNFKNFNIDGATCNCVSSFVGAVAGQVYGDLENISVKNVEFVADPSRKDIRYGAIVGMHNAGNATGCSVENAVVKAYHNVGGISGTLNESNNNRTYRDCSVKNSTFEVYCAEGAGAKMAGALTGNANGVTLYYENCTVEGNNVEALAGAGQTVDLKVPVLTVAETEFEVACDAVQVEIQIESNIAWTVAGEGVKAEPAAGEGDAKVVLTFAANEAYEAVTYEVVVSSEAEVEPVTVVINQEAAPEPEPEFEDGEYWIVVDGKYALPLTSKYGWIYTDPYGYQDNVFTIKAVEGGYTIQDPAGQYYYQTGSYDSFNRSEAMPEEGAVWVITSNEDGSYKILNSDLNKYVQYSTEYNSFGSYADEKGAMPVLVKAENPKERLDPSNWGIIGVNGDWDNDITMYIKDNYFVAYDVEIKSGDFKFRKDKGWDMNYGGEGKVNTAVMTVQNGANITVPAGTYDIYLDVNAHAYWVMTAGQLPTAPDFKLVSIYAATTYGNLYSWSESGAVLSEAWPGSQYETTEEIAGTSYKKWTLVVDQSTFTKTAQFIFNNGSAQTADSKAYQLADEMFFNVSGTDAPTLTERPVEEVAGGGEADFATISATSTSYVSGKTTAGWNYESCAIFKGGTSDSSPAFKMIGDDSNRALCMNGKTTAPGSITSPILSGGCGTLTFNYGLPFSDTKMKFSVDIIQGGSVVKTFTVDETSATKLTKYSHEEEVNVEGDFQIVFKNLSPSNNTGNKDRTAIWDLKWTGYVK